MTDAAPLVSIPPLVSIQGVNRIYGSRKRQVHALKDIDLEIGRGERFGIVGESGSGKSTLIRMIAGLDHPTSGSITVDGTQVSGKKERQLAFLRTQLQFVFQDPMASLDPRMRVRDIITEPLIGIRHPDPQGRLVELLEAVGLPVDAADRFPHQFSGGQRQRISIARALAPNPSILIADEPVSALDVSVRAQILNLLSDLVATMDFTLIFVSHDLSVVRHLCDRVAVLYRGELVEVDSTEEIYSDRAEPYTKSLIAAVPSIKGALAGIDARELAGRVASSSTEGAANAALL
ncbi:ABC transporter ATP-binding protein [soil metagenome]